MTDLTLVAIRDCPLSDHARTVLDALAADGTLAWREVTVGTPGSEQLTVPELLPALFDQSGELLAHGRLSERALRRSLARERSGAA